MESLQEARLAVFYTNCFIKINQLYRFGMSELELYETTHGIWRRKIESVQDAEYTLAVSHGTVAEVYQIDQWYPAGTISMLTRTLDPERCKTELNLQASWHRKKSGEGTSAKV